MPVTGGVAQRLTTHPALRSPIRHLAGRISVAFDAAYEGPPEVYTVSLQGGVAERQTWDGSRASVVGWTPDGSILYSTQRFSGFRTISSRGRSPNAYVLPDPARAGERWHVRLERPDAVLHAPAVPGQPHEALPGRHGADHLEMRRVTAKPRR